MLFILSRHASQVGPERLFHFQVALEEAISLWLNSFYSLVSSMRENRQTREKVNELLRQCVSGPALEYYSWHFSDGTLGHVLRPESIKSIATWLEGVQKFIGLVWSLLPARPPSGFRAVCDMWHRETLRLADYAELAERRRKARKAVPRKKGRPRKEIYDESQARHDTGESWRAIGEKDLAGVDPKQARERVRSAAAYRKKVAKKSVVPDPGRKSQ